MMSISLAEDPLKKEIPKQRPLMRRISVTIFLTLWVDTLSGELLDPHLQSSLLDVVVLLSRQFSDRLFLKSFAVRVNKLLEGAQ